MTQEVFANSRMVFTMARLRLHGGKANGMIGDLEPHGLACRGEMPMEILEVRQTLQLTAIILIGGPLLAVR